MIYYIILGVIITTILLVKLTEFIHLPHEKFRKYVKFSLILFVLLIISFLFRFFPAVVAAIPGVFLVCYRWRFLISILSKLFYRKKSSNFSSKNAMSRKNALDILGLKDGVSREEILETYQSLIKKNHPDLGGSDWITKQINQARDTLLG